jgi:hypothetical protein
MKKKSIVNWLKPIPESEMSPEAYYIADTPRRDAQKTRETRRRGFADDYLERWQGSRGFALIC